MTIKVTYTMYLDEVKELAWKDIEIMNLEKDINKMLVKNSSSLCDNILSELGELYCKMETLKQERDVLKDSLSENIQYIDSYTYLTNKGFETTDELHYSKKTSSDILDYISNYIKAL